MERRSTCDPILLGRYMDGEFGPDEQDSVLLHLKDCPSCQEELRQNEALSTLFRNSLDEQFSQIDFSGLEKNVLAQVRKKRTPWWINLNDLFFSKKLLVPAAAMAAMVVLFFSLARQPVLSPVPSAIVKSLRGEMSSVIILETPKTNQTIIWFNETS